jgi:hypothetical protein
MPFNQKEYMRDYIRNRYHNEPTFRANQKRYVKDGRRKIVMEIFNLLGNKCINPYNLPHPDWCNDPRCLQIDHINGGGCKHLKRLHGDRGKLYREILKEIKVGSKDYQLLCANCNWLKRYKDKEN